MTPDFLYDVILHFGLEVGGQAVLLLAFLHICRHRWHRVAVWFVGTLFLSIVTVYLLG